MAPRRIVMLASFLLLCGCDRGRRYELNGQVLAVDPGRQEITIRHQDIRGFMPGMTMPFKVNETRLLEGRAPGDLVKATLVVHGSGAYLATLERTGHAELTEPPPAARVDLLEPGAALPDVTVTDQSGAVHRLSEWRGHTLAVTFIYTRCPLPDFCPRMNRHFAEVQRDVLADSRLRERVRLLSITFDPDFDTPAVLAEHSRRAGANPAVWSFLTGEREAIDRLASQFGLSITRAAASPAETVHNLRTAVVGGDGRVFAMFSGNDWTPGDLLASLRTAE